MGNTDGDRNADGDGRTDGHGHMDKDGHADGDGRADDLKLELNLHALRPEASADFIAHASKGNKNLFPCKQ